MNNFLDFHQRDSRISNILEDIPLGIILFNADGIIDYVNPAFVKMGNLFYLNISSLTGKNIFTQEVIPGISLTEEMKDLKKGFPFEKEIRNLKTSDRSEISLIVKSSPYYEAENFSGGILILEDLKVMSEAREEELLKVESFKKITTELVDLFFIADNEGEIKYLAGSKAQYIQKTESNKLKIHEIIPGLSDSFTSSLLNALKSREEKRIETTIIVDDTKLTYECIINPLPDKHLRFSACTFVNLTEKRRIENLENQIKLFEKAADVISDGIIIIYPEGKIKFWSPSLLPLTGFSQEESIGKNIWNFISNFNHQHFIQLKEDLKQFHFIKKSFHLIRKSENEIAAEGTFLFGDEDNIIISLNVSYEDNLEKKLASGEENFRRLVTQTNVCALHLDKHGIILYANSAFLTQLHFSEDEVKGKNLNQFLHNENQIEFASYQNNNLSRDLILFNKQGEKLHYIASINFLKEDEEEGFNLFLINQSAKRKERINLEFFKFIFDNSEEGIAVENKGKIIAVNNSFANTFGFSSENEIVGKDILEIASANDVLKFAEYHQMYQARKDLAQRFEFSGKRKDGSTFSCELSPSSFQVNESLYFILSVRDITERKLAQKVIRESEDKYRSLIENIDDFLFTLIKSKLFFKAAFFTNSVEKITGYTQTEMHSDIKLLLKIVHPDDILNVKENLKKFSRSRNKTSAEFEFRIISKQGNIVWVRNKLTVVRNEKGEIEKIYGLVSDISLRKRAEEDLQKTTQNLLKMNETKDKFISIISHDLRTPFSSIMGFTDLLLNDESLSNQERNQYVKYIQESSNGMLSLVNSLLDWTRLQTGRIRFEPERVEASEVISKSIKTLGGAVFQKNISIESNVHDNLFLFIDKDLIGQVFNNLISNAIKFTNAGGSITISASPSQHTRFYEFSVRDTGVGIKPDDTKKLFGVDTKFTTTGTAGEKGTGLGLSLVKEIIEKHGGNIHLESEPGIGTNFIFTLPVAAANILLIDSNTTDRILYSKILKHITSDYEIDTALNGREALNKISSFTYALIVTEHNMPVMGGYDFILELKKMDMKVKPPVIILSNTVDRQTIEDYSEIGIQQVFQKPVNLSLFKQAVEKTLRQELK